MSVYGVGRCRVVDDLALSIKVEPKRPAEERRYGHERSNKSQRDVRWSGKGGRMWW
jgi:hypothetical protein